MSTKSWFEECGGLEPLATRWQGLEQVDFAGASVLDLGAAEGAIADATLAAGAVRVTAVTLRDRDVRRGRFAFPEVRFICADLDDPQQREWLDEDWLEDLYDVVLALSVAHKLEHPHHFLHWAADHARRLVVRWPADGRIDPCRILASRYVSMRSWPTFPGAVLAEFTMRKRGLEVPLP